MPKLREHTTFDRGITLNGDIDGEFLAKNWQASTSLTDSTKIALYQRTSGLWYKFGRFNVSTTFVVASVDGLGWAPATNIMTFVIRCALRNSEVSGSNCLIVGGGLTGGTDIKIRRSLDGGATWGNIAIGISDGNMVTHLAYASSTGYLAVISDVIYQSATSNTGTYLAVTGPLGVTIQGLCTDELTSCLCYLATGDTYYYSTDGTNWLSSTFPNSFVATGAAFGKVGPALGDGYMAIGIDTSGPCAYYSNNLTDWYEAARFPNDITPECLGYAAGNFIMNVSSSALPNSIANFWYSMDGGLNWKFATNLTLSGGAPQIIGARRTGSLREHQIGIFTDGSSKLSLVG